MFVVSQVGGPERKIAESGSGVTWTHDGAAVLFHDAFHIDNKPGAFRQGIFLVPLKTLDKRQLTRAETPIGDFKAAVSPDGTTLAFIRSGIPGLCDVYVVPMCGGEPRRLTDWNSLIEGLAWTPDGKDIIYSVYEPIGPRLWRIPAAATSPGRGMRLTESTGDASLPVDFETRLARTMPGSPISRDGWKPASGSLTSRTAMPSAHPDHEPVFQRSSRWDYGRAAFARRTAGRVHFNSHRNGRESGYPRPMAPTSAG